MVEIRLQLPDGLAQRVQTMSAWLPAVLELSLLSLRSPAAQTASEIIDFLATGPAANEVLAYHVSERAQERLRRLLAVNEAGLASQAEQAELDEIEQIEHVLTLLKAQAQQQLLRDN